jgi:hypothetical protein
MARGDAMFDGDEIAAGQAMEFDGIVIDNQA